MAAAMREIWLASILVLAVAGEARAGAWTEAEDHWQVIVSLDATAANSGFDGASRPDAPIRFEKLYVKALVEYGWSDRLTLFAQPEYVVADSVWDGGAPVRARDAAFEAGARLRLTDTIGVLSVQSSFKAAGPFDLSNSRTSAAADIAELRLLYGTGFTVLGHDGFADLETAERWITHPRPNETVLDATLGLWLRPDTMAMAQSFNTVSGGDARPPYTYFRTHKMELSVVYGFAPHWSLQFGGFVSPAGQNSLVERGLTTAVWARF